MSLTTRSFTALTTTALVALGLAACGSSDADNAGGDASSSSSPASESAAVAKAKESVAALTQRPTEMQVTALETKPASGKTLDFIACGTPTCKAFVPILKEATDAVGWKLKVINGGFDPKDIANNWNQVLRDKPAGVIASGGIPTALFANQLKQVEAAGIPVVLHDQPQSDETGGVTAVVMSDEENRAYGQQMADMIMADSGGRDVHLGLFQTKQVPVFENERAALNETLKSSDCEGCTVKATDFQVADAGTKLPSKVVSFLRSNPDINYVYFDYNDAVGGVPAALERAGLQDRVKLLTNSLSTTEAGYMRNGQLWAAAANPWPETLWKDFHIILAADSGSSLDDAKAVELPQMTLTKDSLPEFSGALFPLVENYQDAFKKAWQVSAT